MNNRNFIIGLSIAAGLLAALIAVLFNSDISLWLAAITYAPRMPNLPRLMLCPACLDKDGKPISTVHHCTPSGEWVCWCGQVIPAEADNTKESE